MGLTTTLRAAVATAFTAVGDLAETVTYSHRTGATYANGTVTTTTEDTELSALFVEYSSREKQDAAILPNDRRAIIQAAELDVQPVVDDTLIRASGETWTVIAVTMLGTHDDPADAAAWDLQVRIPA